MKLIKPMIEPMADSYLELFGEASKEMREFFGLRDFYRFVMEFYICFDFNTYKLYCKSFCLEKKN